ncbi:MAG: hypothetical protein BRC29_00745 [Nanohaloarchaea archaeon SW_7_43_1]|nr:MAG: hypothetical protein BRC29_00745 [Nanohaloarchaea archaeon SW_7_43_1]
MKIGMVTTQFAEVGGVENVVRSLSREMREKHEVHLITRDRPQNTEDFSRFEEVHIIENTDSYLNYLSSGRKWFEENSGDFDVLHFHNWSPIIPAREIKTPKILTFHGTTVDIFLGNKQYHKAPIYWMLEEYAINIADKVTSITESHLEPFFVSNYEIIRNGVNTEKYLPTETEEKRQELQDKYNIEGKGILIVAQHEENKGHRNLIEAASKIDQKHTLMTPSTGPLQREIEEIAEEKDVNAEFYGKIPEEELIELYQAADIFCLPSWNEGLPLSMLEALSCGSPILVSDVADNPIIVDESKAGLTVEPKDVKDLQKQLLKLLDSNLDQKSENARNYAEKNLDRENISLQYQQLYSEIAK